MKPPPRIWTDVALRPEARALLAQAGVVLLEAGASSEPPPQDVDALIVGSSFRGDERCFALRPRLRVVARVGAGYEQIDLAAATRAKVCVVNTPDAPTESTAEFTILLLLATARRLSAGERIMRDGGWAQDQNLVGTDLAGKTLGLIGCGRIGRRVAEIAHALRLRVVAYDPFKTEFPAGVVRATKLVEALRDADFISLHLPADPDARPLFGAAELATCKRGAVLVNAARGSLVDPNALAWALENGYIAAAALDVWHPEPPAADHPLRRHPRVLATPHMAAFTQEGKIRSHVTATEQTLQVLRGERPIALLNPRAWGDPRAESKKVS